ncbi:hypothetical protein [Pseudomonas sp. M5]|uniref:hypothetical protein n=1 Tax=Pseudomonas sp. M5 TaxID=1620788 RepID=UPI00195E4B65|nr:hypothetical protein [Pseudomonas sp. M5]MBM7397426.1 hypothetical protein [Pseudomonas sp. M5]HDS1756204.1 hypothetical protein [Pseudomonas putida]
MSDDLLQSVMGLNGVAELRRAKETAYSFKSGPKRTNVDGKPDKRQRVTPEKQKDHPDLKPRKDKKGE